MPVRWEDEAIVALLEAAPDGILLVDPDGVIVLANAAAHHLFRYGSDQLDGTKIELLIPERFRDRHVAEREGYAAAPRPRPLDAGLDLHGLRSDGEEFPAEISLAPMRWHGQDLVVTIVRDRTQQKLLEEQRLDFARSQAVEYVVAELDAIVWESATPDRATLSFVGGSEAALLGYPRESWLQQGFWMSVVHNDDRLAALAFAEYARTQSRFELEYGLVAADGKVHHVRDIVTVSRNAHGEIEKQRGVIVDMTDRRNLEQQLAKAQKMEAVGQLAGGIAHDFNNLLTTASGYARRLIRLDALAPHRNELSQIIAATDRAAELTQQLLTFARRGQGEPELLDPNETLRTLAPLLQRLLEADVVFELDLDERAPVVLSNRSDLEQIVMNLVLNARDAMPGGGLLTVRTRAQQLDSKQAGARGVRTGPYLLLEVADSGEGIAPEVQARIFEPFFTTKQQGKGTGMGLASVYAIVEHANGFIDLDSTPGEGTSFRVSLPAAAEVAVERVAAPDGTRGTVLLVEDDDALRYLVVTILREEGYLVLDAANGLEALAIAERHRGDLDLLLTDVVMPNLSGPELVQRLRSQRPDVQALYMSGYADSHLLNRGISETRVSLIAKPFKPDDLAEKVSELIAVSHAADTP